MPAAGASAESAGGPDHTLFYLAGEDTAADRHNIALLARVARRSTTPLHVEIFYHRPLQLSNWALDTGNLRYSRLRSASDFVLAERIAAARSTSVLFLDYRVLAHADDLWSLLGYTPRCAFVIVQPQRTQRRRSETGFAFALRSARHDLARYAPGPREPRLVGVNKALLARQTPGQPAGLLQRKLYADLMSGAQGGEPLALAGRSRVFESQPPLWLAMLRNNLFALRVWHSTWHFPWWFSYRHPLFLVAQLGFYFALLVLPVSPRGFLLLSLFVPAITLPYFFGGFVRALPACFTRVERAFFFLQRVAARVLLYLIG